MIGDLRLLQKIAALTAAFAMAIPAASETIRVEISNVRNAKGRVHADICPQTQFLKDGCPYSADAPAKPGITIVNIEGVPPGRYAVQAFHDENGNGEVDRMLFGIPKEGVAFSNDARITFGPPKFDDAAFVHGAGSQILHMRMRYFTGRSGPDGKR